MPEVITPPEIYVPLDDDVLRFADGRIEVPTNEPEIIVDGAHKRISERRHAILALLASWPDHTIPRFDICMNVWGEHNVVTETALRNQVFKARVKDFGPELGDTSNGAIMTRQGIGYSALSSLSDAVELPYDGGIIHRFASERVAVQPRTRLVQCDERLLRNLAPTQFRIVEALAEHSGNVVGWQKLEDILGTYHFSQDTPTIARGYVHHLRSQLSVDLRDPKDGAIRSARDIGYWAPRLLNDARSDLSTAP